MMFVVNHQKQGRKTVKLSQTWEICIKISENYLQKCENRCTITSRKRLSDFEKRKHSKHFEKEEVNGYGIHERYFSGLWSICSDR